MSPRRTEVFHDLGYCQHLRAIVFVGFEGCNFRSQGPLVAQSRCSGHERTTDGLRATHASRLELTQGSECFIVESNRYRLCHEGQRITFCDTRQGTGHARTLGRPQMWHGIWHEKAMVGMRNTGHGVLAVLGSVLLVAGCAFHPEISPWAGLTPDGITLEFGVDTCNADLEASVVESAATVEVTIIARDDTTNDCRDMLTVVLDDPLADRELVDGATGRVLEVRLLER